MNQTKKRTTPIMGWASWNRFRTDISEERMKAQANALVSTGLSKYGYEYFNMDDGFFGGRGKNGKLRFHKNRFPNGIKIIADYVHSLGLKARIYSEGDKNTCAYYWDNEGDNGADVGLCGYEEQDLIMFLEEYKKFHLDGAVNLPYDDSLNIMRKSNPDKTQKLIVYCSAGKRSVQARNLLVYLGYKNVYLLTEHEGLFDK